MKVYVLTRGDDDGDSSSVLAAFSSKEQADAHFDQGSAYATIVEVEVDGLEGRYGPAHHATIGVESGRLRSENVWPNIYEDVYPVGVVRISIGWSSNNDSRFEPMITVWSSISKRHAIKEVRERRREWIETGRVKGAEDYRETISRMLKRAKGHWSTKEIEAVQEWVRTTKLKNAIPRGRRPISEQAAKKLAILTGQESIG